MTGSAVLKPSPYTFTQQATAIGAPPHASASPTDAGPTDMDGPGHESLAEPESEAGTRQFMKPPAGVLEAEAGAQTELALAPDFAAQTVQVVRQCRAFAAAFEDTVTKEKAVRELLAALGPVNIQAAFASVQAEGVLSENYVFETLRMGAGYQPWFVAPEAGVRCLVKETLELCRAPMQQSLSAAVEALTLAVVKAADSRSQAHASVLAGGDDFPSGMLSVEEGSTVASQQMLLEWLASRAKQSIKGWQEATWDKLEALLMAEACLPTPTHFKSLKEQLQRLLLDRQRQAALPAAGATAALLGEGSGNQEGAVLGTAEANQIGKPPAVPVATAQEDSYQLYFMGWLDKLSRRGKWQKRWFVLDGEQRCLYYFGSPEETPARAVVKLTGVSVVADDCEPSSANVHNKGPLAGMGLPSGKVQHVFKLQLAGLANQTAGSKSATIVTLRCSDAPTKSQWLKQIRQVAQGPAKLAVLEALGEAGAPGSPAGSVQQGETAMAVVPRKISTRVFTDDAAPQQEGSKVAVVPSRGSATGQEGACQEAGERAATVGAEAAAAALVDNIVRVHEQMSISAEDRELLACIMIGTKGFIQDAQARLADLTGKVITQGMLGHSDDLYCDLLEVLHGGLA
ncbi:hypothetical protein N2152v2_003763 [Parachlorella kessleri]